MANNGARILWVEDDIGIASLYIVRMEMEGFTVRHCENGQTALEALNDFKPNVILLDLMLPGMSGFDLLDKVRHTPETAHTPVLILSAVGQSEDKERASSLGANEFLVKSQASLDEIIQRLRHNIEQTNTD